MSWKTFQLGDLVKVKHGYAFKGEHFSNEGNGIVLTPGNFHEKGGFRARPGKDRYYSEPVAEEWVLQPGDLIVAMTEQGPGLLGSAAIVPEGERYLHNQRIGRVLPLDGADVDLRFLYRVFNTPGVRGQINGSASGTKVRHTAPERIYRVTAKFPPKPIQSRVADVAQVYDNLIANNRRRIKLLEEAARLIYREWFVRLRFPGHELAKIDNGLPEGWSFQVLGSLCPVRKGKNITKETVTEGEIPVVAGGLQPAYYHNTANVVGPVVTISASGANAGFINLYHTDIWASDCSYISSEVTEFVYFFYLLLLDRHPEIHAMQKGAAQPHVYPKDLERLVVRFPSQAVLEEFSSLVTPLFQQIKVLKDQIRKLSSARDLLLPRLMSGEIEV